MNRKHMPLLVGGLVVLLLAVALVFLLFQAKGRYADGFAKLSSVQTQLQRLTNRGTFPSDPNVQAMRKQQEIYNEYLEGLKGAMKQGQRAAEPVNRDGFRRLLEDGLRQLQNDARAKSVTIAPDLAFGVQRYMAGNPPADDELARLVDQFQSIFALCEILYDAGIGELVGVERTVFEKDAQVAAPEEEFGRRGARNRTEEETTAPSVELATDPLGLFTKEHYVLTYKAQDAANWKVLDRLAHGAPFAVVTSLDVANPARPAVAPPPAPPSAAAPAASRPVSTAGWQSAAPQGAPAEGAGAAPAAEILPRELRVVAGQELPTVRLEVDVYRFAEAAVAVAQGEENP